MATLTKIWVVFIAMLTGFMVTAQSLQAPASPLVSLATDSSSIPTPSTSGMTSRSTISYREPSLVPFNTGPDPFPIVLPSTVIRSSFTTTMITTSPSASSSGVETSDPYSLPGSALPSLVISTPVFDASSNLGGLTSSLGELISSAYELPTTTSGLAESKTSSVDPSSTSTSDAKSIIMATGIGWNSRGAQVSCLLVVVALLVALM